MEPPQAPGERIKLLVEKLALPTMAEFCRRTGLNRGLVDRLTAGAHSPSHDTLERIKAAFPEVNLNWLVSGEPPVLQGVPDEEEDHLLAMYRNHVKGEKNPQLVIAFASAVAWSAQEHQELAQLDLTAKAVSLSAVEWADSRKELLLDQHQRRLISEVRRRAPDRLRGLLETETQGERLDKELDRVGRRIQNIINLTNEKE